jgi:hypothetical protein
MEMSPTTRVGRRVRDGWLTPAILMLSLAPGCMSQQLQFTTRRTVSGLPDVHYQQVIDNLAKIASNPGFLPSLAVAGQGSVQVTDNGSSLLGLNGKSNLLAPASLSLGATRNVTGTWSLGTVTSPEKIRSMQAIYLHAITARAAGDPAFGWLKIGGQSDVPKLASYVGQFADVYLWVMPEGIEGLSDLALAILDVATSEDAGGTSGEYLRAAPGTIGAPRRNFQVPAVGPVFTPGGP